MAIHQLLLRGMLVGLVAGLIAFAFARVVGEPSVARAIAFESAHEASEHTGHDHGAAPAEEAPEIFSRRTQSGIGLLTGTVVYGSALGGLFALAFALCYGRLSRASPRACAAMLALLGFVAVYLVPYLKYPANPPSVGAPDTIGLRTGLYFSTVALSIVAMLAAASLKRVLDARLGGWNAALAATATFLLLTGVAIATLPAIDEVPGDFPADALWQFRIASLGIQIVLWTVMGLGFGALTERSVAGSARAGVRVRG